MSNPKPLKAGDECTHNGEKRTVKSVSGEDVVLEATASEPETTVKASECTAKK